MKMVKALKLFRTLTLLVGLSVFVLPVKAQIFDMLSNPQITLNVVHPPNIGLKITKLAFGPATGRCSDLIVNGIVNDMVNNNIEVIDVSHTASIFEEHHFRNNGYIDPQTASSLVKILGPSSVIVYVKVLRCDSKDDKAMQEVLEYDAKIKKNVRVKYFISKTRVFLKASVQTVDLSTGRTFAAQTFEYAPEKVNRSAQGFPNYPSVNAVQDFAIGMMVNDVHRMFMPWTELTKLYFFNDKDCGLKLAYQALMSNDIEQAFNLSVKALENCKNTPGTKEKLLGHANYNMGMCYLIRNEYDKALEYLRVAATLRAGSIVNEAIANCIKSRDLAFAMQQIDNNAAAQADREQAEQDKVIQAEEKNTLTNAGIIDLTKKKLSKAIILQKIKTSNCRFDTSSKALVALKNAGVNQDVILLMMNTQSN